MPDQEMTVARFIAMADAAIAEISARGRPIIVVGGTMRTTSPSFDPKVMTRSWPVTG